MAYPEIVKLIDSKIARLQLARELLSSPMLPDVLPDVLVPAVETAAAEIDTVALPQESDVRMQDEEPAQKSERRVTLIKSRERRPMRRASEVLPSALRGALPAGPVFVPAARLHKMQEENAERQSNAPQNAGEVLTAALLARRWLSAPS